MEGLKSEQIWGTHFWGKGWGVIIEISRYFKMLYKKLTHYIPSLKYKFPLLTSSDFFHDS